MSEKKKILSFINCFPFLSHITDNPRRQARIKKIDYKDKTNEKEDDASGASNTSAKQQYSECD